MASGGGLKIRSRIPWDLFYGVSRGPEKDIDFQKALLKNETWVKIRVSNLPGHLNGNTID